MKKITQISIIILAIIITGCEHNILDQSPKDAIDLDSFFNSANDLKIATNDLYDILPGAESYRADTRSDNTLTSSLPSRMKGTRVTPTESGSGGWDWDELRRINFVINNYQTVDNAVARKKYSGIAKWFRAYFYFNKVKRFGAVPWYSKVLAPDDSALYKPRTPRKIVMDSVLADINYAIKNIPAEKKLTKITKYTALLLKGRICLFEGTFRKYHNLGGYKKILKAAASSTKRLIESGSYTLYTEGGSDRSYYKLFARTNQDMTETILAAKYKLGHRTHNLNYNKTSHSLGFTKDLINSYLMADGSRFTEQPGWKTMTYYEEMQNRDPRLTQTTPGPGFTVIGDDEPLGMDISISSTGYRVIKGLAERSQWIGGGGYQDVILFRYAEALLIYAEAKAELGTLSQHDLDISINKLRERVDMPHLNMAWANAHPDPYMEHLYPNVDQGPNKGVILEIRRERRIELVQEGFRWWDLMRWREGKKIERIPMVGMYFPDLGAYDLNRDGTYDVYVHNGDDSGAPPGVVAKININEKPLTNGTSGYLQPIPPNAPDFKVPKDYFYPIPLEDLTLNPNLEQNPGWETP